MKGGDKQKIYINDFWALFSYCHIGQILLNTLWNVSFNCLRSRKLDCKTEKTETLFLKIWGSLPFVHHPPVRYAPPDTEHVSIPGKSLCRNMVRGSGGVNNMHPLNWGAQTENIRIWTSCCCISLNHRFAWTIFWRSQPFKSVLI